MIRKTLVFLLTLWFILASPLAERTVFAESAGTRYETVTVTSVSELLAALASDGDERLEIRLAADIVSDGNGAIYGEPVRGGKRLDLNGHTVKSKLPFYADVPDDGLFLIEAGAFLTLMDSAGGGEIIFDRSIPNMGETNAETDIILARPLTVFAVSGTLTVNGGEITAGHYESEYYTYTDGYVYTDSSPSPGTVNSVTPGNAVVVRSGGRLIANGGEYYGRGFTMDDWGGKETACAAVRLENGAEAIIYAGDFYGKSCADVFSVSDAANMTFYAGSCRARYDSRITADKTNGTAYYVNVDCGRIGVPLRAFNHDKRDYTHIFADSVERRYDFAHYTESENEAFLALGSDGTGTDVTVSTLIGSGAEASPYRVRYPSDLKKLLLQEGASTVFLRMENDLDALDELFRVRGNFVLDLNGHTIREKIAFGANFSTYSFITVESGSSLVLNDSAGDGEIVFDRYIPNMGETNAETDIFLARPLTVFDVSGKLTVNGGEITAGHYESEYYTYTKKYGTGGATSPETVHSITPGNAVVVRDGGRFVANGGEYYGRGFTMDENGEKEEACAAVSLRNGAVAVINDGDFYGKSNADVFSVAWGANAFVYSGLFNAQYDNRITVDKTNGTAYYVNVDCGRIGLPLRAFSHAASDRISIAVNSESYAFSPDFSASESRIFENLGTEGTGLTVTAAPETQSSTRIQTEDGGTERFSYDPMQHCELIHKGAKYYNESFGTIPESLHAIRYTWQVQQQKSSRWAAVEYTDDAPVADRRYCTEDNRLDLFALARHLRGGMTKGAVYRVTAYAVETWRGGELVLSAESGTPLEFQCVGAVLNVIPAVEITGSLTDGCKLTKSAPLICATQNVTISTLWMRAGETFESAVAYPGDYRASIQLKARSGYAFTEETTVSVFGGVYRVTELSADHSFAVVTTDPQHVTCAHKGNTNAFSCDGEEHLLVCSVCGAELSRDAHSFGGWTQDRDVDVRTCGVCGYRETVPNGREPVPFIRLTGKAPVVGDSLPTLAVCEEDAKYGALEQEAEWYRGEVNHKNYIPSDTVMEAGEVYYAFVKLRNAEPYYFTDETEIVTYDLLASETTEVIGGQRHLEAVLKFTPRDYAAAAFTLPAMTEGQTIGQFLSGLDAATDGARTSFAVAIDKDSTSLGALVYTYETDAWWIASGDLNALMAQPVEPEAAYRLLITVFDAGKHYDAAHVTVNNPAAAESYSVSAGTAGCTLTAVFRPKPPVPSAADFDGNGAVDTGDVSALLVSILFENAELDLNSDGKTDCLDALTLMTDGSFTDSENVPELFVAVAYDGQGKLSGIAVIDLGKPLEAADLAFLKTAAALRLFYLDGQIVPVAEAFSYGIEQNEEG